MRKFKKAFFFGSFYNFPYLCGKNFNKMKQVLFLILAALCPLFAMNANADPNLINMAPKDESDICVPIKRSPVRVPTIGIDGTVLVRLQNATDQTYLVEITQQGENVFSSSWNFQDEKLDLPSDLQGEYEVILSDGFKSFVGTFVIE